MPEYVIPPEPSEINRQRAVDYLDMVNIGNDSGRHWWPENFAEWLFLKASSDAALAFDMADLLKDAQPTEARCTAVIFAEEIPEDLHSHERFQSILDCLRGDADPEVRRYLAEGALRDLVTDQGD